MTFFSTAPLSILLKFQILEFHYNPSAVLVFSIFILGAFKYQIECHKYYRYIMYVCIVCIYFVYFYIDCALVVDKI